MKSSTNPPLTLPLILASSSVYRKELLSRLQLPFVSITPNVDEKPLLDEKPEDTALRLAEQKANAVARQQPNSIVIGSDQVATLEGAQIGKPGNHTKAFEQLQKMRGKNVIFHTALCVIDNRNLPHNSTYAKQIANCQTSVKFRQVDDDEIDAYLHAEMPYDCAGSAKNEGLGIILIESIQSQDPTALTGLPLIALTTMLRNLQLNFFPKTI